jgi:hypothetical protein
VSLQASRVPWVRCLVDIGRRSRALDIRRVIQQTVETDAVRAALIHHLEREGVLLNTAMPPGWFCWLDEDLRGVNAERFMARCADPLPATLAHEYDERADAGWRYYVFAKVVERHSDPWRAVGYAFHTEHEVRTAGHRAQT